MEFVPFAFAVSVCAIRDLSLPALHSKVWMAASKDHLRNRVKLHISFGYANGIWNYSFDPVNTTNATSYSNSITFEELKRINPQHLQVNSLRFGKCPPANTATLEEVSAILKVAFACLRWPILYIDWDCGIPEKVLSEMLKQCRSTPFNSILVYDKNPKLSEDFLRMQLRSNDALGRIQLVCHDRQIRFSDEVRLAVEEFAISKPFVTLCFDCETLVFDITFFGRLIEKSVVWKCQFSGYFSFDFEELKGFKTEIQDLPSALELSDKHGERFQCLIWRRDDGTRITAKHVLGQVWEIEIFIVYKI